MYSKVWIITNCVKSKQEIFRHSSSWYFGLYKFSAEAWFATSKKERDIEYKSQFIQVAWRDLQSQEIRKWYQNLKTAWGQSLVASVPFVNECFTLVVKNYTKTDNKAQFCVTFLLLQIYFAEDCRKALINKLKVTLLKKLHQWKLIFIAYFWHLNTAYL